MENPTEIVTDVAHLRKSGNSLILTLPKAVTSALEWASGQALVVRAEGTRVVLQPLVEHMAAAINAHEQQNSTPR